MLELIQKHPSPTPPPRRRPPADPGDDTGADGLRQLRGQLSLSALRVVDTRSDEAILGAVAGVLGITASERGEMRSNGIAAGFRYAPEIAAISELRLLLGPTCRAD